MTNSSKKICSHCKIENNSTANFCRHCGFAFSSFNGGNEQGVIFVNKIKELQTQINLIEEKLHKEADKVLLAHREKNILQQKIGTLEKQNNDLLSTTQTNDRQAREEADTLRKHLEESKSTRGILLICSIIGAIILGVICIAQYNSKTDKEAQILSLSSETSKLKSEVSSLNDSKNSLESLNQSLSDVLKKVSNETPLIISNIEVRNDGENYESSIYSSNTTYLNTRLTIFSLTEGSCSLYIKLYTPYGLSRGSNSPDGYSQEEQIYVYRNQSNKFELRGWGNKTKGHWNSGNYRYEIWYKGKCIGTKSFSIY